MSATELRIVWCTCPADAAERIALALVDERLAACVNRIGPVQSTYRWQGTIEQAQEALLAIKTSAACYPRLERRLRELHPHECPEIVATALSEGLPAYLDWVREAVSGQGLPLPCPQGD